MKVGMVMVDIIVAIVLVLSFIGGLKEGAVKNFFSVIVTLIAIPLTGLYYGLIATILAFLPSTNWENFVGFFITMALIGLILQLIFFLPRRVIQAVWRRGILFRLLGGGLNVFNVSLGLVVFTLVLSVYPVIDCLEGWVSSSGILVWLVERLSFVPAMLPEIFQKAAGWLVV